jgi:hypothetical protein
LSVYANGHLLGTIAPGRDLNVYELTSPIPEWFADREDLVLILETGTWKPKALGINQDERDLGVLLDWVKIEIIP